jgi:hypothetical protein
MKELKVINTTIERFNLEKGTRDMTLGNIMNNVEAWKNDYKVQKGSKFVQSTEAPEDFLKRVFPCYYNRPAFIDKEGYIQLSIFGGDGKMDNSHNEERGDSYHRLYIKVLSLK